MSLLTTAQEAQIEQLEKNQERIHTLLDGAASKNMLNRLYVLFQRDLDRLQILIDEIEEKNTEILELVRKAQ